MTMVTVPKVELPSALRIQHPSSNFPKSFEALKNPFANPTDADIDAFVEQAKANEVVLIPQVGEDIERWMDEADPDHMLEFIPTRAGKDISCRAQPGQDRQAGG